MGQARMRSVYTPTGEYTKHGDATLPAPRGRWSEQFALQGFWLYEPDKCRYTQATSELSGGGLACCMCGLDVTPRDVDDDAVGDECTE